MTVYTDSSYGMTRYVSGQKTALSYDSLQLFSSLTQGGTIPFYVRYQYSWYLVETAQNADGSPNYGGWGPLDETVDKIVGTPGLRFIFNLAYAPKWRKIIDASGNNTGAYGSATAVLPDGPAMAQFAKDVTKRYNTGAYAGLIDNATIILQIGNEEYDTALNGSVGGKILAPTFNYAVQAITALAPNALIITGSVRPGSHPNGAGTLQWMNNFWQYVPGHGEPPQAKPYAMDMHFYDDSAVVTTDKFPAPDPTVTDYSSNPLAATKVPIQAVLSIMNGVIQTYSPSTQIWNLENGYSLPNNSSNNHNSSPTDLPSQQSRYTRSMMAQLQYANVGGKYAFYSVLDQGNDPRALNGQAITDFNAYVIANPQWTGTAPTQYLYQSVDVLSFEGSTSKKPNDQYFSIMNPTGSNKAWSISSSNTAWLTSVTISTNGKASTVGAGLTSGTLTSGQCITLKCSADSTANGLATLTTLSETLTIIIGGNTSTITVSLFVTPPAANPNLTSGSAGPGNGPTFTMTANGSTPANQTITFKNADSYATSWYAFTTANWFTINNTGGTLAAGATQNITISMNSGVVSQLAPSIAGQPTYTEVLTISATPFPAQYTTSDNPPPATTQFITIIVKLTVQKAHNPNLAVQLSTSSLYYTAVASGSTPGSQTFLIHNCSDTAQSWTAAKTQSWLTLSKTTSSTNLPANGATTGASPNIQATDYFVITASINSTALTAGTYSDTITVTLGTGGAAVTQTIAVSYVVTSTSSTMIIGASPTSVSASQVQGGTPVTTTPTCTLTNSGNTTGTYTHTKTYSPNGSGWLVVSPGSASLAGSGGTQVVTFTCTPGSLAADTYTATVIFTLGTSTATVTVTFTVIGPPTISATLTSLSLEQTQGGTAKSTTTTLSNSGAPGTFTSAITYTNGSGWLAISPTTALLGTGATQNVTFTCTPGSLTPDTYTGYVIFTLGSSSVKVNMTFKVDPVSTPTFTANPTSLTLSQVQSGAAVTTTTTLSNTGASGTWTSAITYTNGSGWLAISPTTAPIPATTGMQIVTFTCTPGSLTPDTYTGYVVFTLASSTVKVNVSFTVTATPPPAISAYPPSMTFNDVIQTGQAASQAITLTNTGGQSGTWASTIAYGATGNNWIVLTPTKDTLAAGASEAVTVAMNDLALKVGTYTATITFSVGTSSVQVAITLIINPVVTSSVAQMTSLDMAAQYQRILSTVVGSQLSVLAFTYYGNATNNQIIYGELDGLFPYEQISQLHVMKSINDVTNFLNAYAYVADVLEDNAIVYYRLGEVSGISAYDISGRKMTGTISNVGGVINGVTLGQVGALPASTDTAMLFDGVSGSITLPPGVNTANWSALTAEAWINLSNVTFTQTAFVMGNDAPLLTNIGFNLAVLKNAVIFRIGTGSTYYEINQPFTFSPNTWYHLVGVFSGTSLTCYVNGTQIATVNVASALVAQTTNAINIGAKPGGTANNFPGTLDEISLYNTPLSALRVQAHYLARLNAASQTTYFSIVTADSPQAYYRLDESSGLVAFDTTSNHYDAALSGLIVYGVAGIVASDNAMSFDSFGGLTMPASMNIGSWSALSLEYWINITSGWQHIVITVDSSGNTLYYLNGAPYSTGSGDSVVVDQDVYYSGSFSGGSLDEIAVYNYVLSASQVANHYQIGSLGV